MSILLVTIALPVVIARDKNPRRGMRRVVWFLFLFIVLWGYACRHYYYRLG